jgi:hypothetical protein
MEIRHLAFFEFGPEDLEDGFLFDLRKPDEGFLIFDDDGYGGERRAEKVIRSRRQAGLPDVPVLHEMTNQTQRVFVPYEVREATVVHGSPEQLGAILQTIHQSVNDIYFSSSATTKLPHCLTTNVTVVSSGFVLRLAS